MNRREALAALVSLPEVARISTAPVSSTDVIVIECDDILSEEGIRNISAVVQSVWPGRKVLVLERGLKLKVVAS